MRRHVFPTAPSPTTTHLEQGRGNQCLLQAKVASDMRALMAAHLPIVKFKSGLATVKGSLPQALSDREQWNLTTTATMQTGQQQAGRRNGGKGDDKPSGVRCREGGESEKMKPSEKRLKMYALDSSDDHCLDQ